MQGAKGVEGVRSLFITDRFLSSLDLGLNHPFRPERVDKTVELCVRYGLWEKEWMEVRRASEAPLKALLRFHEPGYLEVLKRASTGKIDLETIKRGLGTVDCPVVPGIYEWSSVVAGGTLLAMRALVDGKVNVAFNLYGGLHHGMRDHAEGFCYLNDIAVAIPEALEKGLKVAYVDLDAHHGNGVQEAFYSEKKVLFVSVHETGHSLYPWGGWEQELGQGEGFGYNINIPLEPESDDEVFIYVMDTIVVPLLEVFSPDLLVAQIGADTLLSDPLTHLSLTNNGYAYGIKRLASLGCPVMALGGGGYDIYRTARCWTLAWAIFNELEPRDELAGLVGGMMFGPEMEVGSLWDVPRPTLGEAKEKAMKGAKRVCDFLKEKAFPIHGL